MSDTPAYQVLARKYRPQTFADLIGQEAMVRTLKNAFAADRIAHAFVLTGVRGVGKTTTARIVAKGLNCTGPDGTGGPTTEPCGVCESCRAIIEGRHIDVLEIDAASSTGVDSMREINRMAAGRPMMGRFKIFIIDEVHMLSTGAFNAMLKTLEEPPGFTKFIMATTEIRKVPVTVLSRCQRYDLKRIEPEMMIAHLAGIAASEGATLTQDALALIARAAEGSVRDALSLMDQAIAHGAGETTALQVRAMLGLADRGRTLDLFDLVMRGDAAAALGEIAAQYADGADPMAVLRDLAEITHWISVVKITPAAADDPTTPPEERDRGRDMAARLPMRALSRAWQMLIRAIEEVSQAPNAMMAAEMAIIRLTHVADLPDPETLIRRLQGQTPPAPAPAPRQGGNGGGPVLSAVAGGAVLAQAEVAPDVTTALARYATFDHLVEMIRDARDMKLLFDMESHVRLVRYAPGRIEFQPTDDAPRELAPRLAHRLQGLTGARWGISVVSQGGAPTIDEVRKADLVAEHAAASSLPLVQAVLAAFPGSKVVEVRDPAAIAAAEALPEVEDEWDPFEAD